MIDFTNCEINKFRYYGGKNGGNVLFSDYIKNIVVGGEKNERNTLLFWYINTCEFILCYGV